MTRQGNSDGFRGRAGSRLPIWACVLLVSILASGCLGGVSDSSDNGGGSSGSGSSDSDDGSGSDNGSSGPSTSAPSQVSAEDGPADVTLTWNTVSDAEMYWVYYSRNPNIDPDMGNTYLERVRANSEAAHRIEDLDADELYYFVVTAEVNGTETEASSEVSATPRELVPFAELETRLLEAPERGWVQLNDRSVEELFPPDVLSVRTLVITLFRAWPSMAYIPDAEYLMAWGGGHANTSYNAPFHFDLETLRWNRTFLPTRSGQIYQAGPFDESAEYSQGDVVEYDEEPYRALKDLDVPAPIPPDDEAAWDDLRYQTRTADGWRSSPVSAHTYHANVYLPVADRFSTWGGARIGDGGPFRAHLDDGPAFRGEGEGDRVGPYLLDYAKADPWKVAGRTGSHYSPEDYPEFEGAEAWTVLEGHGAPGPNNKMAVRVEDGKDVIYWGQSSLTRTVIPEDASQATSSSVGNFRFTLGEGASAISESLNAFVVLARGGDEGVRWAYWDISDPFNSVDPEQFHPETDDGYPNDTDLDPDFEDFYPSKLGMQYDPVRDRFVLANRQGQIWILHQPDTLQTHGWEVETLDVATEDRPREIGQYSNRAILGMWKYAPKWDVFFHMTAAGDVWAWKPEDWSPEADISVD